MPSKIKSMIPHFISMETSEILQETTNTTTTIPVLTTTTADHEQQPEPEEEESPIEQVRLTVSNHDDPTLPVWTFRMWFLGLISCSLLSFLDQFFAYRAEPLMITQITVQVACVPIGHLLAAVLPEKKFRIPGFGDRLFSLNPGPFNIKEHVLITMFANAGAATGRGYAYGVSIVNVIIAFYHRKISFLTAWLLVVTTQVLGYGWAGILRKYVVEPAHMWWPGTLAQVSLFRALHERQEKHMMTRAKFFLIALACSFCWYLVPGYFFSTASSIAWVCWVFPNSVTAQQLGSGMRGLGIGAFTLDWSTIAAFLGSPLIAPFFTTVNILVGYALLIYVVTPIAYWGFDLFDAQKFPIFSTKLFTSQGKIYDTLSIVNDRFELDLDKYTKEGKINLSMFFALSYGIGFASTLSTVSHVVLFYGREIYKRFCDSYKGIEDVHTRMMKKYEDIPSWWFHVLLVVTVVVSLVICIALNEHVQLPWWGFLLASCIAFVYTLPISVLIATTNMAPGLNYLPDYIMGIMYQGRPIANVAFNVYCLNVWQAISFLGDFKLGHYMKIPPRSMFLVQLIGTIIAGTINISVAWWLLHSIENICEDSLLSPNSPWTCPYDRIMFDTSVVWGLVGPKRILGAQGNYRSLNWFFLGGAIGPVIVWLLHKAFPNQSWIPLVNIPVLLGAAGLMPPAMPLNYNAWITVGITFNYFIFRYRKKWWQNYNYILSAALDSGVAFMTVLLYFALGIEKKGVVWWGTQGEHCPLASCPIAKGIDVDGCPLN